MEKSKISVTEQGKMIEFMHNFSNETKQGDPHSIPVNNSEFLGRETKGINNRFKELFIKLKLYSLIGPKKSYFGETSKQLQLVSFINK